MSQQTHRIDIPGVFEEFFSGTGLAQGQRYSADEKIEAAAAELRTAHENGTTIRRGRGHSIRMQISDQALAVLYEIAEDAIVVARTAADPDDMRSSETAAARKVLDRCWDILQAAGWTRRLNGQLVEPQP